MLPASLSQRTRVVVLGVVGTVAAFFLFGGARSGGGSSDPLSAMPRDSFLVASVDLAELRRSPIYDVLFGSASAALDPKTLGIGKLADACGFDPLARVERLAIGVPEEGDKGELGVAARVSVTRDELAHCSQNLAGQRGSKVETRDVGSFVVIEDGASATEAARPRLAYGQGGLLVVGRGAWLDAMLAAADGKKPGVHDAPGHAALRASITSKSGWATPTVLVSALLPKSLRDRLRAEMDGEAGSGKEIMAGVLGVASVGVALRAGASGDSTQLAVELFCDSADAAAAVEKLILKKRLDWSKELLLRMVGLGTLLDSVEVTRDATKIRVTAGAPSAALASTLERVLRFAAARNAAPPRPAPEAQAPAGAIDGGTETIPAPRPR